MFYVTTRQVGSAEVDSQLRYATLQFRNDTSTIRRNWRTLQQRQDWGDLRNGRVSRDGVVPSIGNVRTFSSTTERVATIQPHLLCRHIIAEDGTANETVFNND